MTKFDELHKAVKAELLALREAVPRLHDNVRYLTLFDELLREEEFGSALELLCDFLLEPNEPPINDSLLTTISSLHASMGVTDTCSDRLRKKAIETKKA